MKKPKASLPMCIWKWYASAFSSDTAVFILETVLILIGWFELICFLQGWVNEFTKWNPVDFCGIHHMCVAKEMLWIPDINIIENIRTEFSTQEPPVLKMMSEGIVTVVYSYTMTSACKMNLYKFPFDTQSCTLTLQSFLHYIDEFRIKAYSNASMLTDGSKLFFKTQGEWDLISINMSNNQLHAGGRVWDQLLYTITIKRRPLLYVVIFLLPILYFLVLDLASFFISDDGGEKLSFKVTLLLAISVLLLILHDMLPSTSDDLPLIGVYCSVIFTFTTVSVLETILVNFLKTRSVQAIPKWFKEAAAAPLDTGERASHSPPDLTGETSGETSSIAVLQQILSQLQKAHHLLSAEKQQQTLWWTKVAEVIDKTFTVIYVNGVMLFLQQMWQAWFS
uniref:Si:ch211-256e16.10 n=1 Tax=Astyanax mexicanus TaxID=7994 RepID=A0A8B9H439_ASTMX